MMSLAVTTWSNVPSRGGSLSLVPCSFQGISVQGGLCPGDLCPRWSLSRRVSVQGGLCPGDLCPVRSLSMGVSVQEISVQGGLCPWGSVQGVSVSVSYCKAVLFEVFSAISLASEHLCCLLYFSTPRPETRQTQNQTTNDSNAEQGDYQTCNTKNHELTLRLQQRLRQTAARGDNYIV